MQTRRAFIRKFLLSSASIFVMSSSLMAQNTPAQNQAIINSIPWTNGKNEISGAIVEGMFTNINGTFSLYAPLSAVQGFASLANNNTWTGTNTFDSFLYAGGISMLTNSPWTFFYGIDGTPQGAIGYTWNSNTWCQFQGSFYTGSYPAIYPSAANGTIVCRDANVTDDVNANLVAANNGHVHLWNGWGIGLDVSTAGGNQLAEPISIVAGNFVTPGNIIDTSTNSAPLLGGYTAITQNNLAQLYSLNANPDFQFDQINVGQSTTVTTGQIVDGWSVTDTQTGKLSYQRIALASNALPYVPYGELVTVVAGSYSPISTDAFGLLQNMSGFEVGQLQFGTSFAQTFTDTVCVLPTGVTVPFVLPVAYQNNDAGTPDRTYMTTVTLTAAGGWNCFNIVVPGDTAGTWYGLPNPDKVGLRRWIDFGSGLSRSTSVLDAWQGGNFETTSGAGSLVTAAAGATLTFTRMRLRPGNTTIPYAALPETLEYARDQSHAYSTFGLHVKPAQNVGVNTGEIQFAATTAGANAEVASVQIPTPKEGYGASTSTFYNPAAANANCRDETLGADGGAVTVLAWTQQQITIKCNGNASTAVGDIMGVHMLLQGM